VTRPSRPVPPPLEGNDQLITGIITAGWAIALLVLLALRARLPAADHWWIWTCAAGVAAGLFGLYYVPRLKRARERAEARRAAAKPAGR
jgi:Protein of unknown function (DUF2530)